jgi:hypothetical protein
MLPDDGGLEQVLDDLGLSLEATAGPAVAHLADRFIQGASKEDIDAAAARAAVEVWRDDVADAIGVALARLRGQYAARLTAIEAAAAELTKPAAENAVAVALAARAAVELWARARKSYGLMAVLEDELRDESPARHRSRVLVIATAAIPILELEPADIEAAVTRYLDGESEAWLARRLATDERRTAMRRALGQLAEAGFEEFPLAAGALTELLAEPMPGDPGEDDLWVSLVIGLAQQHMQFEPG